MVSVKPQECFDVISTIPFISELARILRLLEQVMNDHY